MLIRRALLRWMVPDLEAACALLRERVDQRTQTDTPRSLQLDVLNAQLDLEAARQREWYGSRAPGS